MTSLLIGSAARVNVAPRVNGSSSLAISTI
jgi:hypothetical protein